jgi:hypothetical protein
MTLKGEQVKKIIYLQNVTTVKHVYIDAKCRWQLPNTR